MATEEALIVDELISTPSTVTPTLFVGLGGCGCQLVARVADHLQKRPDYRDRYEALNKFALVDTNVNDLEAKRHLSDDAFLISNFEKAEYANLASGKDFLERDDYFTQWVPQNYRFRAGDTSGAGQIRIESRLGCYYQMKHGNFVPRFRRLLEQLKSHEHGNRRLDTTEIRIVMCFSVAGGTGSGANLTLAYLLRDLAEQLGKSSMVGVAVLPSVFEEKVGPNRDGIMANGYAALKEIEHLMKLGAPESSFFPEDGLDFHYDPSDPSKRRVFTRPFEFLYVVDNPESFTVDRVVDAAADGLYLQLFSPAFAVQAGDYDNYTQHQRFLVPHDFEGRDIQAYTSFYGSYGAATLVVPGPGLAAYCANAAALSVLRESFVAKIPAGKAYRSLQDDPEPFYRVRASNEPSAPEVHEADFNQKDRVTQDDLKDALYAKRIRLLARAELDAGFEGPFRAAFAHGHVLGMAPNRDGDVAKAKPQELGSPSPKEKLKKHQWSYSVGALILGPTVGDGRSPGLLAAAYRSIEDEPETPTGPQAQTYMELIAHAEAFEDDLKNQGRRLLRRGNRRTIGFDRLEALAFLYDEASDLDLVARRYFAVCLREALSGVLTALDKAPDLPEYADASIPGDRKFKKEADKAEPLKRLVQVARERANAAVREEFVKLLQAFADDIGKLASTLRSIEGASSSLEKEVRTKIAKLRKDGTQEVEQYVLDAEALQLEDGRRMWDFYYAHRIASLREVRGDHPEVKRVWGDAITSLARREGTGTRQDLRKALGILIEHLERVLTDEIVGDPNHVDEARRVGLTLVEALELEVEYRALYHTNREQIERSSDPAGKIRALVGRYFSSDENRIDLTDDKHQDYLRDKVKRLMTEKAELLCLYEETLDQHGGVRPDKVFLAVLDEKFPEGPVRTAIERVNPAPLWVHDGWNDPRVMIVYRAVLNVPLYVFGRMAEMREQYYRFRRMAKRSKVLHIDKNWEETLPDLDPHAAMERHKQELVRANIIDFATLLEMDMPRYRGTHRFIVRQRDTYLLRDPNWTPDSEQSGGGAGVAPLGASMVDAVEALPALLESQPVKYHSYRKMLAAVRRGLAPSVLLKIAQLPKRWLQTRDELQTAWGQTTRPDQVLRLKDFTESYTRLSEALLDLHDSLVEREKETQSMGTSYDPDSFGMDDERIRRDLRQSIEIVQAFREIWNSIQHPENDPGLPPSFQDIFEPLETETLREQLDTLRGVVPAAKGGKKSGGGKKGS